MRITKFSLVLVLVECICVCVPLLALATKTDTDKRLSDLRVCLEQTHSKNVTFVERLSNPELYERLNFQFNSRLDQVLPLGYVVPESTEDVQIAVKCGRSLNISMVPKGGGYSYEKYSFGHSDSVIVDLRNMSSIHVEPEAKTVDVGSGALIGHLYWALWTNGGFGIAGSDCVSIGVAGLSLGGGHGYWGKRYGLTLDSILEMEFVDADGERHLVNQDNNTDLFWALRGGGSGNFGIVTQFKYKIFDASSLQVTRITLVYRLDQFREALNAYMSYIYRTKDSSVYARFRVTGSSTIDVNIMDVGLTEGDVEGIVGSFPPPNSTPGIKTMNFIEFYTNTAFPPLTSPSELGEVSRESIRFSLRAKSYYSSNPLNVLDIATLEPILTSIPSGIWFDWSSLGGEITRVPANATAYVHRNSLSIIQVAIQVESEEAKGWVDRMDKTARLVLHNGETYQNHIDAQLKEDDYLRRYYGQNLERLVQIKARVDKDNYFNYPLSIPTSISKINEEL